MERINIKKLIYEFGKVIISVGGRFHAFNLGSTIVKARLSQKTNYFIPENLRLSNTEFQRKSKNRCS